MTIRLAARGIVAGYHARPRVLDQVDLEVLKGSRLALLGANGSGKTTLLKCLSGALKVSSGKIETAEGDLSYDRSGLTRHRQQVQLVLQDPDDQLFAGDVFSDVAFGPTNLGLDPAEIRSRVTESCELLGISELLRHPVHQLSYGQRKRVAIAGAVAMRPDVVLLDEPTAGLDPAGVLAMRRTLTMLEDWGTTIVLSTHDVQLAWEWADRIALVGTAGVTVGPTTEVLTHEELVATSALELPWPVVLFNQLQLKPDQWPRTADEVAAVLRTTIDRTATPSEAQPGDGLLN